MMWRVLDSSILEVVDSEAEVTQDLLEGNPRVTLEPFLGFGHRPAFFVTLGFVVKGRVGDSARNGIEHGLEEANDGC
jgi:hypothetical protein